MGAAGSHELPFRKHPAHGVLIPPEGPTLVHVIVCTRHRRRWLATSRCHRVVRRAWEQASLWLVGRYAVLPDHIHLFASPAGRSIEIEIWCKYWKSLVSKELRSPQARWQSGQWHTRLRNHESYAEKWEYVRNNPVRHGLVARPEDWPYQGEVNEFRWFG